MTLLFAFKTPIFKTEIFFDGVNAKYFKMSNNQEVQRLFVFSDYYCFKYTIHAIFFVFQLIPPSTIPPEPESEEFELPAAAIICIAIGGYLIIVLIILLIRSVLVVRFLHVFCLKNYSLNM